MRGRIKGRIRRREGRKDCDKINKFKRLEKLFLKKGRRKRQEIKREGQCDKKMKLHMDNRQERKADESKKMER